MNYPTHQLETQQPITEPPNIGFMQIDDVNTPTKPATFLRTLLSNKHLSPTLTNQQNTITTTDLSDEIIQNTIVKTFLFQLVPLINHVCMDLGNTR